MRKQQMTTPNFKRILLENLSEQTRKYTIGEFVSSDLVDDLFLVSFKVFEESNLWYQILFDAEMVVENGVVVDVKFVNLYNGRELIRKSANRWVNSYRGLYIDTNESPYVTYDAKRPNIHELMVKGFEELYGSYGFTEKEIVLAINNEMAKCIRDLKGYRI